MSTHRSSIRYNHRKAWSRSLRHTPRASSSSIINHQSVFVSHRSRANNKRQIRERLQNYTLRCSGLHHKLSIAVITFLLFFLLLRLHRSHPTLALAIIVVVVVVVVVAYRCSIGLFLALAALAHQLLLLPVCSLHKTSGNQHTAATTQQHQHHQKQSTFGCSTSMSTN
jgi:hypothetical protein